MKQMIIEKGRKQIMAGGYGMGIPGQMKVDIFHRNDLRMPASRTSSLNSKHRTERGLPQSKRGAMP